MARLMMRKLSGDGRWQRLLVVTLLAITLLSASFSSAFTAEPTRWGAVIPWESAGSMPVLVNWSILFEAAGSHEAEGAKKCGGRARRADGNAQGALSSCEATAR